ncbi:MAG: Ig-like domain-containing protein [Elusimicrobia bacterium]|nr:Ig-like domain-containing protein [Elusimicrobiota bacterium]
MRNPISSLALVLVPLSLALGAAPVRAQCVAATAAWKNSAIAAQSAPFTARFTVAPSAARIDGVTGLSPAAATGFAGLAVIVRFNNAGYIDARNGGVYAADASIPYTAGAVYAFRLAVDPGAKRYSVWVAPPGGAERALAANFAFRTEQAGASSLGNWALTATSGGHQVCAFALSSGDTVPPTASVTSPAAGTVVSGAVTLAAAASDNVGVAGVQFQADGVNVGAEATQAPYSTTWNTAAASNSTHLLTAIARDAAGNRASSPAVTVTVNNVAPPPSGCVVVGSAWRGEMFAPQSAAFVASFDAVPDTARMDGVTGLAGGAVSDYSRLAAAVRFNNAGFIDARNGSVYAAAAAIPYSPGAKYHFRLVVDPSARRYSAYVTPPGASEAAVGTNYAFRAEQASLSSFDRWAGLAGGGTHQVCGFSAAGAPPPASDLTPPAAAFVSPAAGATVSGSVALTATASDNVGVAGVQFQVDGANLGAELTQAPYTLAWNSASAANASHTLRAVARDAAGNKGSASITVTVNNAPPPTGGADRFGIKMLYPSSAGGKNWVSTWDNGRARTFSSGQADPEDPWFRGRGNAVYGADGKGVFSMSGSVPRMYIHDPQLQQSWRNVESTVYAYRVADSGTAYGGIVHLTRTNHSAYGASETINGCDSRGNGARFRYDGHIDFEKETKHPSSTPVKNRAIWSTLPYRTWIGYKLVVYDLPNGNVKLESYMDLTDGANGGTWTKVNELEDTGANFGVGGAACKSGIDPALRLTNSDSRPGSETGRPNIAVYWRSDNVGTNGLLYKKMSVREIAAP